MLAPSPCDQSSDELILWKGLIGTALGGVRLSSTVQGSVLLSFALLLRSNKAGSGRESNSNGGGETHVEDWIGRCVDVV